MKRGISPVVATAILVLIAVAVSVIVYLWITGEMGNRAKTADLEIVGSSNSPGAIIEKVNDTFVTIQATVKNSGTVPITVEKLGFVCPVDSKLATADLATPVTVQPGEITQVSVTINLTAAGTACATWDDISKYDFVKVEAFADKGMATGMAAVLK